MRPLAELSEESRQCALTRYELLESHLNHGRSLRAIAEEASIPYRTMQRWIGLYRKYGLAGLVRKNRQDKGQRRAISAKIREVVEGLALERPPLPIKAIHRKVCEFADLAGEAKPTYGVVYDLIRKLPQGLITLAHQGGKVYSDQFDLVYRRQAIGPNSMWQADHCLLDIPLLKPDGSTAKPWLTAILDDYSRTVAGYYLAFDPPSTLRTALTLRQAIWRKDDARWPVCGIPQLLYTDHGSDFTSLHMEQVAIDLKMRLIFSLPGKPRGRGRIERFFRTVNEMFLPMLDGYLLRNRKAPTLTLATLEMKFLSFILDQYHRRPSPESEIAPVDRWQEGGFLPRMPESVEQLDLLLMQSVRSRKVRPDGIHFESLRYLSATLAAYVGEEVEIRYDPRDMGEIRVFHEGKFLCRAIASELAGESLSLKEILQARNRRRRELRTVIQNRRQAVDALIAIKRGPMEDVINAEPAAIRSTSTTSKLKRYRND
jgi:putative transposase